MDRMRIYIEKYGWVVDVYTSVYRENVPMLVGALKGAGAEGEALRTACENIGWADNGLTYTNGHHSVVVVSHATSINEFANTLVHELNHVCSDIENVCSVDPHGEEASYLIGDLMSVIIKGMAHK